MRKLRFPDYVRKLRFPDYVRKLKFPEYVRKLRFPDYVTMSQDGGKVASLTNRPPLPPGNTPGTRFC